MDALVVQVLNALFYASILFLIASGLSLIYGVMGIVNMAHGSLFALGAFLTATITQHAAGILPVPLLFVLLPLGAIAVGVLGLAIEPLLLRPLYARGAEEYPLLITFGLLLVLEDVMRFTWGGNPLSASNLVSYLGSVSIFGSLYPLYVLFVIGVGIVTGLLLWVFVYRTKFGIILRATSQDMKMASGLGLDVRRVYVMAFAVGCFLVGLGGAVVVPYQAAVLGMGMDALILAFVVVVVGGLGSLKGAFVGALIVGFVRTFGIQFFPEIELAVLYVIAAAVLLVRPTGLFGRAS
jgi:branched-subunit amino acid ABC-type transport system permease component